MPAFPFFGSVPDVPASVFRGGKDAAVAG